MPPICEITHTHVQYLIVPHINVGSKSTRMLLISVSSEYQSMFCVKEKISAITPCEFLLQAHMFLPGRRPSYCPTCAVAIT